MKHTAMIDGQRVEIEITRSGGELIEAVVDGRRYVLDARTVEPGAYWFNCDDRSIEISVAPEGDGFLVSLPGRKVPVEIVDARAARRKAVDYGHTQIAEVRSPMPGKVVKILVTEGAEVEANQGIVVMEAMKMQNELKSPKKGIVKTLAVREGVAVSAGDLLATVE